MDEAKYRKDRDAYVDQYREACRSYDGAVLTLAAAAFGISVTIVDKIGHSAVFVMVGAWILFAVSIVATLWSFFASQHACDCRIKELDRGLQPSQEDSAADENVGQGRNAETFRDETIWLNRISFATFVAGLALFSIFVIANFAGHREATMSEKKNSGKVQESVNTKVVQDGEKRGYPTVSPPKVPPASPPASTSGESTEKKQ